LVNSESASAVERRSIATCSFMILLQFSLSYV
jgi:hypothetical protein